MTQDVMIKDDEQGDIIKDDVQMKKVINYFESQNIINFLAEKTTFSPKFITQRAIEFINKMDVQDFENRNKKDYKPLSSCTRASKQKAFMDILSLNLPSDFRSLYYMYNRNGTLVLEVSYKGMILLSSRYGIDCSAELVYEGDEIELTKESNGDYYKLKSHNIFKPGNIIGAIVQVDRKDMPRKVFQYSFEELEASRKKSKAPNSPAWVEFKNEMYKKCAYRKAMSLILSKIDMLPKSVSELLTTDYVEEDTPEVQSSKTEDLDCAEAPLIEAEKIEKFNELKEKFGIRSVEDE